MTNPQTEARAIARFEITYDPDIGMIHRPHDHGYYVRYEDHATALVAKDAELAAVKTKASYWQAEYLNACRDAASFSDDLLRAEAALAEARKALEAEGRRATDAEYFNVAYRNMLGPIGRKVAEMWREKGVKRIHFDWGPDADSLTGEERARIILDIEARPSEPLDFSDGKGPRAALSAPKGGQDHG